MGGPDRDGGASQSGGLCIPLVTPLDGSGKVAERDLRSLIRFTAPHAPILFVCGTTGEWNRIGLKEERRALEIGIEAGRALPDGPGGRSQVWAGATALTREDTLKLLSASVERSAAAAVVAPLAVRDLGDLVRFFQRDVDALFEKAGRTLPVYLYDNADIAVDPEVPHMHTRDVKQLSRLPWIWGIKVSGSRAVLGNYTKAAANFRDDFRIFAGNPMLAFELFRPRRGIRGTLREYWDRWLLHDRLPVGIVAGTANLAPALWRKAWAACVAGDAERMEAFREALAALSALWGFRDKGGSKVKKTIAGLKQGLVAEGVFQSARVAQGTPALTPVEEEEFLRRYNAWKQEYGDGLL